VSKPQSDSVDNPDDPVRAAVTLQDVDIRAELPSRPCRRRDYESEHRALAALAQEMTENPRNMLQKLVETAIELCHAETAGISLLEAQDGEEVFRWEALAGVFASYRNKRMPRDASPCGVCIDENRTQLMYMADRLFPALLTEPRVVEALLIPFQIHGEPVGTVWVVSHTEGRQFDREDERIMLVLAQFAAAAWQLWKAVERSDEANLRKDQFLAMLSHELRTPLSAIAGAAHVVQTHNGNNDKLIRAAEILSRQTRYLSGLVEDLLDVSRIGAGKFELHKTFIELRLVIDQAVETVRERIAQHRHRLIVTVPEEAIHLEADFVRLTQLLVNLLENAIKYTPDEGRIWLAAELSGQEVRIKVRDNGIGIPKDKLTAVFDLFTQLGGEDRSEGGLGLGLRLVQTLAELHGGTADATSEGPGKGSEFTVTLPVASRRTVEHQY
jgi:signal transduction histidine kinase